MRFAYALAVEMGELDVEGRIMRMTAKQFFGWRAYYYLEPFGELREDFRNAKVVKMVADVNVKPEDRRPLDEHMLRFKGFEEKKPEPKIPSWQRNKSIMYLVAASYKANTGRAEPEG